MINLPINVVEITSLMDRVFSVMTVIILFAVGDVNEKGQVVRIRPPGQPRIN